MWFWGAPVGLRRFLPFLYLKFAEHELMVKPTKNRNIQASSFHCLSLPFSTLPLRMSTFPNTSTTPNKKP